jgi:nitroimidazol reductase NimA-like FMN-containing flavoprotein (pyridoxamine 5'-phosphate oxidase superfamily)
MAHAEEAQGGDRDLRELSVEECRALLPRRGIGRVVFVDARGPVALPVNFVADHDDIVFRTGSWSSVLATTYAKAVSFEIDEIDLETRTGWSLLATGHVAEVVDPADLRHVELLGVTPWARGPRHRSLRLRVRTLTGRRLSFAE